MKRKNERRKWEGKAKTQKKKTEGGKNKYMVGERRKKLK
jgi:hypothetical protein